MTYYAGPQPGDERPKGGGRHNEENIGHELFNFAQFGGRLYGWVRAKKGRVNAARIDPEMAGAEKLDDVLIIFVARQHIIGWSCPLLFPSWLLSATAAIANMKTQAVGL
jgi:hypothetical protein